jgi:16S rRNA (uracil1498-N3)-methyltransferase
MDTPTFYAPQLLKNTKLLTLDEATSRHAVQVLRMQEGEQLQLTNGKGWIANAEITSAHKKETAVTITVSTYVPPLVPAIILAVSLLKNVARIEWLLEKVTEIGVAEIIPLICHRTERQAFRHDRMNGIIISAMLQSQQAWLPVLHQPTPLKTVIETADQTQKMVAHCIEDSQKKQVTTFASNDNSILLIGPEGDFTPDEIEMALGKGFVPVSLGETRLRTETAAMVGVVVLRSRGD